LKLKIRKFFFLIPIRQAPERPWQKIVREPFPKAGKTPTKLDDSDSKLARSTFQLDLDSLSQLLQSQSFVDPEHVWEMPVGYIKPYRFGGPYKSAYSFRLSKDSYNVLARKCGVEPEFYPESWQVKARDVKIAAQLYLGAALQLYPSIWREPTYPTFENRYLHDIRAQAPTIQQSWGSEWDDNVWNGATNYSRRGSLEVQPPATHQQNDYFTQQLPSGWVQEEHLASFQQDRLIAVGNTAASAFGTPSSARRLNPAAADFAPRSSPSPSPSPSTSQYVTSSGFSTTQPNHARISSPMVDAQYQATPSFAHSFSYSSIQAPTLSHAHPPFPSYSQAQLPRPHHLIQPMAWSIYPTSTMTQGTQQPFALPMPSPTYQTSTAMQEPVIPITPYLLRNNIGRVRQFVCSPGEEPITISLPAIEDEWFVPTQVIIDEDGAPEAALPDEFELDEDELEEA
jgi:hypothetical protein